MWNKFWTFSTICWAAYIRWGMMRCMKVIKSINFFYGILTFIYFNAYILVIIKKKVDKIIYVVIENILIVI